MPSEESTHRALSLRFAAPCASLRGPSAGCCAKVDEPRGGQVLLPGEAPVRLRDPRRQARLAEGAIPLFADHSASLPSGS